MMNEKWHWSCSCWGEEGLPVLHEDVQNEDSHAWRLVLAYIEDLARSGEPDFCPSRVMDRETYRTLRTLPREIGKLRRVRRLLIYGSSISWLPPEIGDMESLEEFDVYTSYRLHWYPYELTRCRQLVSSRMSTRTLYGNLKYRPPFPSLKGNPMRNYLVEGIRCSVCREPLGPNTLYQYWISMKLGTDVMPLLANVCGEECRQALGPAATGYVPHAHRGGWGQPYPKDSGGW